MNEWFAVFLPILILLFGLYILFKPKSSASLRKSLANQDQAFKWESLGDFQFEVVGESHYQRELKSLAGDHGTEFVEIDCEAALVPEDDNKYDPKAVAIFIEGIKVGYLSRDDARSFRRRLGNKRLTGQITYCDALIVGGGIARNGRKMSYGIRLDIKPFY